VSGCFSLSQAMRTLNWKYHLGLVSLDVELADRTLSLSVSPVHAAIILHFQTKSECRARGTLPPVGGKATLLGWLKAPRALAAGPRAGSWAWICHKARPGLQLSWETARSRAAARHPACFQAVAAHSCSLLAAAPQPSPSSYEVLACWRRAGVLCFSLVSVVSAGTWTLTELSEVLKVPVTSLKRKMTLWLQQGVLREEPQGTFTVIEEEQKDQVDKVVLIDSDEEGDSAMASQADQKEEELQVPVRVSQLGAEPAGRCKHALLLALGSLVKMTDSVCTSDLHFPLQGAKSSTSFVLKGMSLD